MEITPIQVGGAVGIVMALIELLKYFIGKYFAENKAEKEIHASVDIVNELKLMNSNHLNHIENAINCGSEKTVSAIQNMHLDIVKELSRK